MAPDREQRASRRRPEVLAPAGNWEGLRTALASGADAVYFGLDAGFNARARAANFDPADLPELVALVHRAGARAYLTMNTLVFESELAPAARFIVAAARAGVDALIIQDVAVALLAARLAPSLELHASTQMTVSSAEGTRFAADLGISRVVVPRELSVDEIRALASESQLELEVFVHGALCVSWSGQCLSSEAWGGRSANRGQCAQACRLPYELEVDGEPRPLGDVQYLLSPGDLAGVRAVPALLEIGVHGLKIEGRLKAPSYVASAVSGYRRWVDSILAGAPDHEQLEADLADMALAYSRGFTDGFLGGSDHQRLVEGRAPRHRGIYLGRVVDVRDFDVDVVVDGPGRTWTGALALADDRPRGGSGAAIAVAALDAAAPADLLAPEAEPKSGMGVVFDAGTPDQPEPGGPLFAVERRPDGWRLRFGRPGPDMDRIEPGMRVWLNGDPAAGRAASRAAARPELAPSSTSGTGRVPLAIRVGGGSGEALWLRASAAGGEASLASDARLSPARGGGLSIDLLREKLGQLGGTPFHLAELDAGALAPGLHLPVSELKALRRAMVAELTAVVERGDRGERAVAVSDEPPERAVEQLRAGLAARVARGDVAAQPIVVPLCRTDAQLDAAIAAGVPEVELDWMEMVGLARAVARARAAGLRVTIATVRVQKPGEEGYDARIARLEPDAVLIRHLGALVHFRERAGAPGQGRPALHGDFSLNATNSLSALHFLASGLETITCAHDLDAAQMASLLDHVPPDRVAVTIHHHIPTFHTEHCVYAHLLSAGRDYRTCGRPCEQHQVSLRDRVGLVHPVMVDVACRNTIFNAQAQSAATLVPRLVARGVRRLRVELVRETGAETAKVLAAYRDLVSGKAAAPAVVARIGAHEQFGVTRGTMKVLG